MESHLEAAISQLKQLKKNNAVSVGNIKKQARGIKVLTGAIIKSTTVAATLQLRFQSVKNNVGNILVKMNEFSQNMAPIQKQLATMAPGTFAQPENPTYLNMSPRSAPVHLVP